MKKLSTKTALHTRFGLPAPPQDPGMYVFILYPSFILCFKQKLDRLLTDSGQVVSFYFPSNKIAKVVHSIDYD